MTREFTIVFEDKDLMIIDKPNGLAVQSKDQTDLLALLKKKFNRDFFLITRLDQPVSGLVVLAKSSRAAAKASRMLQSNKIQKTYLAVVEGRPKEQEAAIESQLHKKNQKTVSDPEKGKSAVLRYRVIKNLDRYSILEINTETGRFHQIRAQLQSIGHPIKGDLKYGAKRSNKEGGIYLHCQHIWFEGHPESEWTSAPPETMPLFYA